MVAAAATATEMPPAARGEKTFSEEMRAAAMRLHTKDQAKEGEKEPEARSAIGREPIVEGYLHYLVDSKLLFQTLENIVDRAVIPCCERLRTLVIGLPFLAFLI
jgi:heme oxygenase